MKLDRRRLARLFVLIAGLLVATFFSKHWPRRQTIHYVLGDAAPRVAEIDAAWAAGRGVGDTDRWDRRVELHYDVGQAPRVLTQEPKVVDGDYTVQIEIVTAGGARSIVRKTVTLGGGVTPIDLAGSVPP